MRKLKHNPIIGYHAIDLTMSVIGPAGTELNPLFSSEERARQAAQGYGQEKYFLMSGELWLGGILGVVLDDVGDIHMDGVCAQRFIRACQRNDIPLNQKAVREIDAKEQEPQYSCRQLLTL
jgi:hypothetical protein